MSDSATREKEDGMSAGKKVRPESGAFDDDNFEGSSAFGERGKTDCFSPVVLVVLGVLFLAAAFKLGIGTLSRPGPGMWPGIYSAVLVLMAPLFLIARHKFTPPHYKGLLRVMGVAVPLLLF